MPAPYLANALAKLRRENDPERAAEIEAMAARLAVLDAEREAEDDNPRIHLGANNPPEETKAEASAPTSEGFDAIKVHIEDLLIEARNWADGASVENQAQADEIAKLIDDLRKADTAADDARKAEVKPLDDARQEIQDRYNVYIAPLKNKKPGKVPLAIAALKTTVEAWLKKLDDERRAAEEAARKIAEAKAAEAAEAMRAAIPEDFGAREEAEEKVAEAKAADAAANQFAKARAHAHGGGRALGLRTYYTPVLTAPKEALIYYAAARPDEVKSFLLELARQDVAAGRRSIPGFDVQEDRRVA